MGSRGNSDLKALTAAEGSVRITHIPGKCEAQSSLHRVCVCSFRLKGLKLRSHYFDDDTKEKGRDGMVK